MKYIRVSNNTIVEIVIQNPKELFHPLLAAMFFETNQEDIEIGYTLVDNIWTRPILTE